MIPYPTPVPNFDAVDWMQRFLTRVAELVPGSTPPRAEVYEGEIVLYVVPEGGSKWARFRFEDDEGLLDPDVVAASVVAQLARPSVRIELGLPPLEGGAP